VATKPGPGGRLLFAIGQQGTLIAAVVAAFMAASWWPLVVGAAIGLLGLPALLRWRSPLVIVTGTPPARSWRRYTAPAAWIAIAILLAAASLPFLR
jgi:hypothetical protein